MIPVAHFSRRYRFSASHRLFIAGYSEEQNQQIFGKCANPYGHGHNYVVEVTVAGPVDPVTGMVMDLVELDALVQREILDRWDHTNLNQDELFSGSLVPSTENFTFVVEDLLRAGVTQFAAKYGKNLRLVKVRVEETNNNSFDLLADHDTGMQQGSIF